MSGVVPRDPAVLAALAVAIALRVAAIDGRSFTADEAYSAWVVQDSARFFEQLSADNHPPLWYGLLAVWIRFAGDGDVALRLLSAAAGALTVILAAALARELFGVATMRWAAIFAAGWPLLVAVQRDARMYAWLPVAALAAALALEVAHRDGRVRAYVLAGVGLAALASIHHFGLFVAVALVAGAAARDPARQRLATVALPVAALAYVPGAMTLLAQLGHGGASRGLGPGAIAILWTGLTVGERGSVDPALLAVAGALTTVALALGGWAARGYRATLVAVLVVAIALPVALSAVVVALPLAPRYFVATVPFLALALARLAATTRGRPAAIATIGMLAASLALAAFAEPHDENDWRGLARLVAATTVGESEVRVAPSYFEIAFRRYYAGPLPVRTLQRSSARTEAPPTDAELAPFVREATGWVLLPGWLVDPDHGTAAAALAADDEVATGWWMRAFRVSRPRRWRSGRACQARSRPGRSPGRG